VPEQDPDRVAAGFVPDPHRLDAVQPVDVADALEPWIVQRSSPRSAPSAATPHVLARELPGWLSRPGSWSGARRGG
jgi:hypothetical protein